MAYNAITVEFDWGTPSGNKDITTTPEIGGGRTPIAAVFAFVDQASSGVNAGHNRVSLGLFDGTTQYCISGYTPDCCSGWARRRANDNACMVQIDGLNPATIGRTASAVSFITNGVRINVPADYGDTRKAFVTLFFSDTGSAVAGKFSPSTSVNTAVTVTPGISTSALITMVARTGINNTSTSNSVTQDFDMNIGFVVPGQGQAATNKTAIQGTTVDTYNRASNSQGSLVKCDGSNIGIEYGNFTATQFDATTRQSGALANTEVLYLCLDMPGVTFEAGIVDTPTTASEINMAAMGVPAAAVLFGPNFVHTLDSTQSGGFGEYFGVSAGDAFGMYSAGGATDDNSGSPEVSDRLFTNSLIAIQSRETATIEATGFTPVSDGVDVDFTTVNGTARKWAYLAVEGSAVNLYQESLTDSISVQDAIALAIEASLSDSIGVDDSAFAPYVKQMIDSVGVADTIEAVMTFVNAVSDTVDVSGTINTILKAYAEAEDTLSVSDAMAARGVFIRSLSDSIETSITINVSGIEYVGLVLNTANMAVSTYRGWDFNSFAEIDGHYIGAGREGIYELDGADDDGANIDWEVDFGYMDFDTSQDKRLPEIFYSCRSDGTILFKVTHTRKDGTKVENWYQATRTSDATAERRVKTKKGAKSQYWRLQMLSQEGSSLDLEKIELTPLHLMRKL